MKDSGHGWYKCPKCKGRCQSFWEHQFGFDCTDCRMAEARITDGKRLSDAVDDGNLDPANLSDVGRERIAEYKASLK